MNKKWKRPFQWEIFSNYFFIWSSIFRNSHQNVCLSIPLEYLMYFASRKWIKLWHFTQFQIGARSLLYCASCKFAPIHATLCQNGMIVLNTRPFLYEPHSVTNVKQNISIIFSIKYSIGDSFFCKSSAVCKDADYNFRYKENHGFR